LRNENQAIAEEALLEGFAVNALFSPKVMDRAVLEQIIPPLASILLKDWLRSSI
jgi:hypothetical protein